MDFLNIIELNKHILNYHEGKKPFQCLLCESSFSRNEHLSRHIGDVHERKKPYECSKCNATYTRKEQLKKHVETDHEGENPLSCVNCGLSFSRKIDLKRHDTEFNMMITKFYSVSITKVPKLTYQLSTES